MKSLYRRWRPLKLSEVVGQEQVTKPLSDALEQKKISHAYLFTGPRGTGKTSVARIFAHAINDFDYQLEDEYVDIIEIDGASNRGIENIREIREKAMIRPTLGKYKIYIIDEVHMLTREAFNALLKTLEEPPEHVVFIMATTDFHKVPITITSRAQTYNFKLVAPETIFKHLEFISKEEGIKIEKEALELVVKRGGGSFRDSLSLLDQVSHLSHELITSEMLEKAYGLPEEAQIDELLKNYLDGDTPKIVTILQSLFDSGVKAEIIAEEIITKIIKEPTKETLELLKILPDVKTPFSEAKLLYGLLSTIKPNAPISPSPVRTESIQKPSSATAKIQERHEEIKKPDLKSRISDIIGGKVEEYGGGSPF